MQTVSAFLTLAAAALTLADHQSARDKAAATGKSLVVGVGCAAPAGDWVHVNVKVLDGFKAPCIVVDGKELPASSTADDVRKALKSVPKAGSYYDLRARAVAESRVLLVGIGCDPPNGDWLTYRVKEMPWGSWDVPCVAVFKGREGSYWWYGDMRTTAIAADIAKVIKRMDAVSVAPSSQGGAGSAQPRPAAQGGVGGPPAPASPVKKWNPDTQPRFQERMNWQSSVTVRSRSC